MANKLGLAISTNKRKPVDEQAFINMKKAGIEAIELSYPDFDNFDFKAVGQNAENFGVKLWSLHLPFMPFGTIDPSDLNKDVRKYTIELFTELMGKGSEVGIDKFVVHPSGEPIKDDIREDRMLYTMESFNELAEIAARYGGTICVEDLPRSCLGRDSSEILRILSVNDKLRACFDTNHLLKESIPEFIRNVGNKIVTLHVSDYDFKNERHWLPGEGDVNWAELYEELMKTGYSGMWLYEVGLNPEGTINRRVLDYCDFYNNAQEIFEGKKPTPIGVRKENL